MDYRCTRCGHVHEDENPDKCEECDHTVLAPK